MRSLNIFVHSHNVPAPNFSLDLPDDAPVVSGDRLAIEEILDNLVSNAIKYGGNKPIFLRGFVSAYSQNDLAGTRRRFRLPSHPRQCGLLTLRVVTGAPPYCRGPGMPQRAVTSSRSPSAPARTIGAT